MEGFDDFGIRADFSRRAFGDLDAVIQDGNAFADTHDHLHVMFNQQNGDLKFLFDEPDELGEFRFLSDSYRRQAIQ